MAKQNSSVKIHFAKFLAKNGLEIKDGEVVEIVNEVMEDVDTVVCHIRRRNGRLTLGKMDKALKSNAPVIEFITEGNVTPKSVLYVLKRMGYKFNYTHHDSENNVVRSMKHKNAPNRVAIVAGRNNKYRGGESAYRFELA